MTPSAPDSRGDAGGAPDGQEIVTADSLEDIEPALEHLPAEQRDAIVQVIQRQLSHSGPLPAPEQLRAYEEVLPGLAERIVRLTEKEQDHRHEVVDISVKRGVKLRERGQALGMVALVLTLAFCVYLVYAGSPETAGAVAIGLVAGVVSIFVLGRRADIKERQIEYDEE